MLLFAKSDVERGPSVFGSGRVRGETRGSCLSRILYAKPGPFISTENNDSLPRIGQCRRATGGRPAWPGERNFPRKFGTL